MTFEGAGNPCVNLLAACAALEHSARANWTEARAVKQGLSSIPKFLQVHNLWNENTERAEWQNSALLS